MHKAYFITRTPLDDAAFKSILSTPVPARPTSFNLSATSKTSAVTFVADLTIRAS